MSGDRTSNMWQHKTSLLKDIWKMTVPVMLSQTTLMISDQPGHQLQGLDIMEKG